MGATARTSAAPPAAVVATTGPTGASGAAPATVDATAGTSGAQQLLWMLQLGQ